MPRWLFTLLLVVLMLVGLMISNPLGDAGTPDSTPTYSADALNALLAVMREAQVDTGRSVIRLQGVANAGEAWSTRLAAFRKTVADDVTFDVDVFVINPRPGRDRLCEKMFASVGDANVSFRQSGAQLRSASHPALDRLAEFARDCPQTGIVITGHSDSTGSEFNNKRLSRARAQAVADYLVARGAAAGQLQVVGAGSDQPIADDATPQGRALNRRIEFKLREPQ